MRVSHIRHTKGGGETSDSDRVFAELAYERFLKPRPDVASSEYDNLHRAFIDKTLECSLLASAKAATGATFARKTPDRPPPRPAYTDTEPPTPTQAQATTERQRRPQRHEDQEPGQERLTV